jgi:hypothetical protein
VKGTTQYYPSTLRPSVSTASEKWQAGLLAAVLGSVFVKIDQRFFAGLAGLHGCLAPRVAFHIGPSKSNL